MQQLIEIKNGEITIAEEVKAEMKRLNELKVQADILNEKVRDALLTAMREHSVKSIENDVFKAVYKAPSTRKTVDTQALKNADLYEAFTKETPVKESVTLTYK